MSKDLIIDYIIGTMYFNPDIKVVLLSPTYRQSQIFFELLLHKFNSLYKDMINFEVRRDVDYTRIKFSNGSSLKSVPIGDGYRIRGYRPDLIVLNESSSISKEIFTNIVTDLSLVNTKKFNSVISL